jgi:epoxyqueuosine reductase
METLIDLQNIKTIIKTKSKELGFSDLKVAKYKIFVDEIKNYNEWIQEGKNATMGWMERNIEKRADVRQILPETKSIITLSYNYFTGNIHPKEIQKDSGKISRYAWGSDYHDIVIEKLRILENELKILVPDSISKSYIDTGPTLDKQWAVQSGLGWQGKNSLIISKNQGSYFFIGLIFTSVNLTADEIAKDYCGSCTKCITACPTNAIIADKIIDSSKCISFWTIEAKPDLDIPDEIKDKAQNWIYGCDICQEVCPWNRHKPKISDEILFKSRIENGIISKEVIDKMQQEEFSRKYSKSPIKRLKLAGLKRNSKQILK